eukprot:8348072-Pyramimonas_sp.AAC.1
MRSGFAHPPRGPTSALLAAGSCSLACAFASFSRCRFAAARRRFPKFFPFAENFESLRAPDPSFRTLWRQLQGNGRDGSGTKKLFRV